MWTRAILKIFNSGDETCYHHFVEGGLHLSSPPFSTHSVRTYSSSTYQAVLNSNFTSDVNKPITNNTSEPSITTSGKSSSKGDNNNNLMAVDDEKTYTATVDNITLTVVKSITKRIS
jgi:hypothetical protein